MNNKLKIILHEKKAEFYIQTLIGILIFMFVFMIGVAVTPVMIGKIKIDYAADEIARYIALTGQSRITADSGDTSGATFIGDIIDTYNIDISNIVVSTDVAEAAGETRIQLSNGFAVRIDQPMSVDFGGFDYTMNIVVSSTARGRSEVYWKALDNP